MKTTLTQCGDRPRVEQDKTELVITYSDVGGGEAKIRINMHQCFGLASDILEVIHNHHNHGKEQKKK